ncbi:unnamed protein product [Prunus brigantina]
MLLITKGKVPCRVPYVSASAISYPKDKEWDYFKGIPMSAVTSRQGFQGGRALASFYQDRFEHLKFFKGEVYPIRTDGSKNNEPLDCCNTLFLFFSSLNISDRDISDVNLVYEEVKKRERGEGMYKIVWIPVVEKWNEKAQQDFERWRAKMPWYAAECRSPRLHLKNKWHYKDKPILVVMNLLGQVKNPNALPSIRKDGMEKFPFDDVPN